MAKVSVIIPVYGVEKYIEKCARCLFEQTLEDVEYIFVDDCSKDNSISILNNVINEYSSRRAQISILRHENNKGLPQARKTGILKATGEYIAHCDSDDWIDKQCIERLYNTAKSANCDILFYNYYLSDGHHNYEIKRNFPIMEKSILMKSFLKGTLMGSVCLSFVKSTIYKNTINFPSANKCEDLALLIQLLYYSQSFAILPEPLYFYRYNPNSISFKSDEKSCLNRYVQAKENIDLIIAFLKGVLLYDKMKNQLIATKFLVRMELEPFITKSKIFRIWSNTYPEIDKCFLFNKNVPLLYKLHYLSIKLHLLPTAKIIKLKIWKPISTSLNINHSNHSSYLG